MVHVDIAALRSIEREKEIAFDTIIDALETALLSAYKHTAHSMPHARVVIDRKTGEVVVWAQELDADGGLIEEFDDTPTDFGRVAATTARQVILQRLRDAEHDLTYGGAARVASPVRHRDRRCASGRPGGPARVGPGRHRQDRGDPAAVRASAG